MKKRSGFTLLELLVVISLLAVILPMAGGTVFFLLRAQSQSADALRDAMAITQLSHVFRSDVHSARSARVAGDSAADEGVLLDLDGSRVIEYRTEPNDFVSRIVRRGETVERRERFRVGPVRPKFAIAEGGREIAVTIAPRARGFVSADKSNITTAGIRIAAIIGRNAKIGATPTNPKSPSSVRPPAVPSNAKPESPEASPSKVPKKS
jgi:prepilin-type N-terminal cleavage/methylation domain-containing protein